MADVWRATIKGLMAHKIRLALMALAVVLGVAFVSGTYLLTDTMNKAFDDLFQRVNRGVAVEVSGIPKFKASGPDSEAAGTAQRIPAALLQTILGVPGVRTAEGSLTGYAQLVGKDGKAITTGGAPTLGVSAIEDRELSGVTIRSGRLPQGPGQIVIDAVTAQKHDFRVGEQATVLLQGPPMEATIVGIIGFGEADNLGGATLVGFDPETAQTALAGGGNFDTIEVAADKGVSPAELRDRIQRVLPDDVQAKTGQQAAQDMSDDVKKSLSFFNIVLLVFAVIALFVGSFIIHNTFSIVVGQRTRELALLRALGASGRQVRNSVLVEATIVGLFASLVGLGLGFGLAIGLQAVMRGFGIVLPTTSLQLLPRTILASLYVGVGTTLFSSIAPARRASKVPPVAAMRGAEPTEYTRSRRRTISGALLTVGGIATLSAGLYGQKVAATVGLGAALIFFGVAVLSPMVVGPVARVLGAPVARLRGIAGKLGKENAARNPKRTASTSAALMIGLALVAFVSVFAASIKASTARILEQTLKADYIVTSSTFTGFSQDVAARLKADPAFSAVEEFRQGLFGYKGGSQQLTGIDPSSLSAVANLSLQAGRLSDLDEGTILVYKATAEEHGWKVGDSIPVQFARTGTRDLRIVGIYTDNALLGNFAVSLDTFEANFTEQLDITVLAKTAAGVSQRDARAAVTAVAKEFPNVKLEDQAQFRKSQANAVNLALAFMIVLLALSVVIAVIGIVNTLALSVFERTRELGLLRAVGMNRRQTRTMIRWEAILISVFGALLGAVVGIFFGWAMVQALHGQGITVLSIPGGQLVAYVLIAAVFGVIAAVFPAWRATRLDVLKAIVTE